MIHESINMFKQYRLILIFLLITLPILVQAAEFGFLEKNIWLSRTEFAPGEIIRVYTILLNNSEQDVQGDLYFYDNGWEIGKTNFSLPAGGKTGQFWVDWKASEGRHNFTAEIKQSYFVDEKGAKNFLEVGGSMAETGIVSITQKEVVTAPNPSNSESVDKENKNSDVEVIMDLINNATKGDKISRATSTLPLPTVKDARAAVDFFDETKQTLGEVYQTIEKFIDLPKITEKVKNIWQESQNSSSNSPFNSWVYWAVVAGMIIVFWKIIRLR